MWFVGLLEVFLVVCGCVGCWFGVVLDCLEFVGNLVDCVVF